MCLSTFNMQSFTLFSQLQCSQCSHLRPACAPELLSLHFTPSPTDQPALLVKVKLDLLFPTVDRLECLKPLVEARAEQEWRQRTDTSAHHPHPPPPLQPSISCCRLSRQRIGREGRGLVGEMETRERQTERSGFPPCRRVGWLVGMGEGGR